MLSHLSLCSANRSVITVLRERSSKEVVAVVNCHLSAGDFGDAPRKRLQQVADGLETARKELAKAVESANPTKASGSRSLSKKSKKGGGGGPPEGAVCVVGDFNSDATDPRRSSAVAHFLSTGEVGPDFREDAEGGGSSCGLL